MINELPYDVVEQVPMTCWEGVGGAKLYLVHTMQEWRAFFKLLMKQKLVACDTETTGFQYFNGDKIVGMSFGWKDTHFYVPVRHSDSESDGKQVEQLNMDDIRGDLQTFFSQKDVVTLWHNCMHASSKVLLADGNYMCIDKMVKECHPGPVLTLNEETGKIESKKVVNWLKGDLRPNEEWLRIETQGKGHIVSTIDHEIITARGRVRADALVLDDLIATALPSYSQLYEQFLLGTLLGDSSIVLNSKSKSPSVICAHSEESYGKFKAEMFNSDLSVVNNSRGFSANNPNAVLYKSRLRNDERLNKIYDLVTVNGKKELNTKWIEALNIPAIAVWYCDDGWLESGKYPKIVTKLTKDLESVLLHKLKDIGLHPTFWWRNKDTVNISFSQEDLAMFSAYIDCSMERKLPEDMRNGCINWLEQRYSSDVFYSKITAIVPYFSKINRKGRRTSFKRAREYCIAVEGNHNFFVNSGGGLNVSNCKFDAHFYRKEGIEIKTPFHDTRILWQLYDENAPGALKVIASGWVDSLGIAQPGLVGPQANAKEREIDQWRSTEASTRRKLFNALVVEEVDRLESHIEHQDKNRILLKKWVVTESDLKNHKYANVTKDDIHYGYIPIPLMVEYAATDTFLTYKVYEYVMKHLPMSDKLQQVYVNEIKLSRALMEAEEKGVCIDRQYLINLGLSLDKEIENLKASLKSVLGDINLDSNPQLSKALKEYGIPLTRTTGTGNLTVDKKVLSKFEKKYPIIADLLLLKEMEKIRGTYVAGILEKAGDTGILHCSFNQNVSTGRMSSQDPNLQNIPNRDNRIRKAFVNLSDDYIYVFADYSQVEVRLTAHYSEDPLLLDSYKKDQDVHTRTMCEMFGFNYDEVTAALKDKSKAHPRYKEWDDLRTIAKRINFGIIYGVGAPGLSEQIPRPEKYKDLTEDEWINVCQGYIDQYMRKYIGVKRFINKYSREIRVNAKVENHFGRIRRLPHAHADKLQGKKFYWKVGRAQRQGVNFVIQGCQDPNAPVLTEIGYIPINKLEEKGKPALVTYTGLEDNYTVLKTGIKDCLEVVTSVSTGIVSTDHKYFVLNDDALNLEFKSIKDIQIGDLVVAVTGDIRSSRGEPAIVDEKTAELIGILIGDGSYGVVRGQNGSRKDVHIRNIITVACGTDEDWADYVLALIKSVFPFSNPKKRVVKKKHNTNFAVSLENKEVRNRLIALGLKRVVRDKKEVPAYFMTQPANIRAALLKGLMDTDGGINGHTIGFTNKSKNVAESVQLLLQSLGIQSSLRRDNCYFRVLVDTQYLATYINVVKHELKHKEDHAVKNVKTKYTKAKVPNALLVKSRDVLKKSPIWSTLTRSQKIAIKSLRVNKHTAISLLSKCPQSLEIYNLIDLLSIDWAYVKEKNPVGSLETMDLELHGEDHSYICRGLVQHNTAADIFKTAVTRVYDVLKGTKSFMVNFVHDEIQMYIHKDELHLLNKIKHEMEDFDFIVPIVADFSYSKTDWANKKGI